MNASHSSPFLTKLRRQLEEILAMLGADAYDNRWSGVQQIPANRGRSERVNTGGAASAPALQPDDLFDKALAVITEFGQTTPAILQMWLGIDYGRAVALFNQFEAQGLISSRGRVRHKAFELRRSRDPERPLI